MTKTQNHLTQEISRTEFVSSQLAKLGDRSSSLGMAAPLADVDYLLTIALGGELDPETLDALVWAITSHKVDWPYQFWCAKHYGHGARLDQVLEKADVIHLRAEHPVENHPVVDLAAALSE